MAKSALSLTNQKASEDDIGGTNRIARGRSGKDSRVALKKIEESDRFKNLTESEKERLQAHLNGPNAFQNKKRRQYLREDDKDPQNMDKLNPFQKRSLLKRKRKGDRILQAKMNQMETKRLEAALAGMDAEMILNTEEAGLLETENEMERTYKMSQLELKRFHLNEQTARHIFDLKLEQYNPYGMQYDRSGRFGVLYGQRGHISLMDMHTLSLKKEFYLEQGETIRDATFLHNSTLFALAQKKNVFIYDDAGVEIHRLSEHIDVFQCQFLPYHWLLTTVGRTGILKYHDTSTGELVSAHRTKLGPCKVMRQNQSNAIMHLGHSDGKVTLWSPANSDYLVKMACHRGAPIHSLAIDKTGHYMVTGGADSKVKIWDLRMYKETHSYHTWGGPPVSLDISQRGILGIGHGCHTSFWKSEAIKYKVKDPYMNHSVPGCGPIETIRFRPFEDICGIGHQKGYSSIVIPGSGDPNLDTMEYNTNPFQDKKQRREAEVRALLDKLSPEMIAIDPDIVGTVEESNPHRRLERQQDLEEEANARKLAEGQVKPKEKKRMRGKNKIQKKLNRKMKNVIDENKLKLQELKEKERIQKEQSTEGEVKTAKDDAPTAIKRFFK